MPEADRVSRDPSPISDGALSRCRRDYTVGASPSTPQEEIVAKILTPPQPAPVMDIARELVPPGMELVVVDPTKPEFYDQAGDAEYYLGSPRTGIGNEFFRAAPRLKLVQLTSAGYDRV